MKKWSGRHNSSTSREFPVPESPSKHRHPPVTSYDEHPVNELSLHSRIDIEEVQDIVRARQEGRELAANLGFSGSQATLVATAISELARNIVLYAGRGRLELSLAPSDGDCPGLVITCVDDGPGIGNIEHAMMSGYSTSGGLGLGLPGVRQIVDEFTIKSEPGKGTWIECIMWR